MARYLKVGGPGAVRDVAALKGASAGVRLLHARTVGLRQPCESKEGHTMRTRRAPMRNMTSNEEHRAKELKPGRAVAGQRRTGHTQRVPHLRRPGRRPRQPRRRCLRRCVHVKCERWAHTRRNVCVGHGRSGRRSGGDAGNNTPSAAPPLAPPVEGPSYTALISIRPSPSCGRGVRVCARVCVCV